MFKIVVHITENLGWQHLIYEHVQEVMTEPKNRRRLYRSMALFIYRAKKLALSCTVLIYARKNISTFKKLGNIIFFFSTIAYRSHFIKKFEKVYNFLIKNKSNLNKLL
jgi:hypothetical protein